jgi:hypothetical protein
MLKGLKYKLNLLFISILILYETIFGIIFVGIYFVLNLV